MNKSIIETQIKDFEHANEVVNDVRVMLAKTVFEGTQENALRLTRAYSLLKNLYEVNTRQVKILKDQLRRIKNGQEPQEDSSIHALPDVTEPEPATVTQ